MGQRMDDVPLDYGDNCIPCWPVGETPDKVYARFSLMEACTPGNIPPCQIPPNDRVFTLHQHDSIACIFRHTGPDWTVSWRAKSTVPAGSWLQILDSFGWHYFYDIRGQCPAEGLIYRNDWVGCIGQECANGGIGIVTWTPQATALLAAINMEKAYHLFMELRPLDNGNLVYKFTRLRDATNIKILFSP